MTFGHRIIAPLTGEQRARLEAVAARAGHPADIVIGWWRVALDLADDEWDELGPRDINPSNYRCEPLELKWLSTLIKVSAKPPVAEWNQRAVWALIQWGPAPVEQSVAIAEAEELPSPAT